MEAWRHGGMEAWRHGGMEAWRHGGMEAWSSARALLSQALQNVFLLVLPDWVHGQPQGQVFEGGLGD